MEQLTKKTIGQQINAALASKDVKQKELAKHLGVPDNTISYFVSGRRVPNTEQIIKIAQFLNVSTDYLLGLTDVQGTDTEVKAICEYTGLSEEAIEELHHRVKMKNAERSEYPWMSDSVFFQNQNCLDEYASITNDIICSQIFVDAIGCVIDYIEELKNRINSIDNLIKRIDLMSTLDDNIVKEIEELSNEEHEKYIRLGYFEMVEAIKIAIEQYCADLSIKHRDAEIALDKYKIEAILYKNRDSISDEKAERIRKEIYINESIH